MEKLFSWTPVDSSFWRMNCWLIFIGQNLRQSKSYLFKFFKGCLPKNLLSPLLNTLTHLLPAISINISATPNTSYSRLTKTTWQSMLQWCQEFRRHFSTIYQVKWFLSSSLRKWKIMTISDQQFDWLVLIWLGWKDPWKLSNFSELINLYIFPLKIIRNFLMTSGGI